MLRKKLLREKWDHMNLRKIYLNGSVNTEEKRLRMRVHKNNGEEFKFQIVNKNMAI